MKSSFPTLREVAANTQRVFSRYPFVVLCAVADSGAAIVAVEAEGHTLSNVIMAASLGLPVMFGLRAFRERATAPGLKGPILEFLGLAALCAYGWSIPSTFDGEPAITLIRYTLLLLGSHLAVAFVPCLAGAAEDEYWEFNRRLFQRFALSVLYTFVLFTGFSLAISSANKLFSLEVPGKRYFELWILMTGVFNTLFFLGGAQPEPGETKAEVAYPRGLRAFAQFALAPLVLVFAVILYLFVIKIIRVWSWPHGWVAFPVCALTSVGILAALLLQPARTIPTERWAQWYWKWFFRASGPLSILLLLSIRERVTQFGVTEPRYYGAVIGFWLLAISVYFVIRREGSTRWIPASLSLLCFTTAVGPWGSFAVSMRSQVSHLQAILAPVGGIKEGKLVPAKRPLSGKEQEIVRSIIGHLVSTYGTSRLHDLFSEYEHSGAGNKAKSGKYRNTFSDVEGVMTFLGVPKIGPPERPENLPSIDANLDMNSGLPVRGSSTLYIVCACPGSKPSMAGDLSIAAPKDGPLVFRLHGKVIDSADFERLIASLSKLSSGKKHMLLAEKMTATLADGPRHWTVIVSSFSANTTAYGSPKISQIELYVLE